MEVFPGGSVVRTLRVNAGDADSIPGSGRTPGERNGNPPQYACLGNPMDRGAWRATNYGVVKESDTTYQVNNNKDRMEGSVKGDRMNPVKT